MSFRQRLAGFVPDTLFARIAAVLLLNLILVQGVSFAFVSLESRRLPSEERYLPERIVAGIQILNAANEEDRARYAHALSGWGMQIRYVPTEADLDPHAPVVVDNTALAQRFRDAEVQSGTVSARPPVLYRVGTPPRDDATRAETAYALQLDDGSWMEIRSRRGPPPIRWYPILSAVAAVCLVVSLLALLFARGFSRRLADFAETAEAFGRSINSAPLAETGPREIKRATHAFNQMQERLRRFVNDRTRMLAAISHDLRTPLTRLRLRAEFVEDEEYRTRMLCEIAEMEAMLGETLAFARDDAAREQRQPEDLDKLLADLTLTMQEAGHAVMYAGTGPQILDISPIAMRRAFSNLLENAVNYGGSAEIEIHLADRLLTVIIADHGPGIEPEMLEQVFQPFFRLEYSRNRDTGGVGLGLSVARTIIRGHGGDIVLENRIEGGLAAKVTLPM